MAGQPNYDVMEVPGGVPVFMWRRGVTIEDPAIEQLKNLATLPFIHHHVAAMPDTHWGMGSTVGSVFGTLGAVIPAAVGVDIGCGMIAARTELTVADLTKDPNTLAAIRKEIERRIPMGRTNNGAEGDRGAWHNIPDGIKQIWEESFQIDYEAITEADPQSSARNHARHLGTLGTGNHFIEIQRDQSDRIWIMLHSGSRGPGNKIGSYFTELAKRQMESYFIKLREPDLAYFPHGVPEYARYIRALKWAQRFAFINRQLMLEAVRNALAAVLSTRINLTEEINTHHNYAQFEHHLGKDVLLTRKGAISAKTGEMGIIPGSMGAKSYIVRGLGNPLSFNSCSHGAGRAMSRNEAKKRFTVEDHVKATDGVECRKDADVIDETPMAYKSIDAVIEAEKDLVEVVHTMKQLICCKG